MLARREGVENQSNLEYSNHISTQKFKVFETIATT